MIYHYVESREEELDKFETTSFSKLSSSSWKVTLRFQGT
jgi:hypothetical protein